MASSYPASLDSFTRQTGSGTLAADNGKTHKEYHDDAFDGIEAVQSELGTDPAGTFATVRARLDALDPLTASAPLFDLTTALAGKISDTDATDNTHGHSVTVDASTDYLVTCCLMFNRGSATAGDVKIRFAIPTGANMTGSIVGPDIADSPITLDDVTVANLAMTGSSADGMAGIDFPFATINSTFGALPTIIRVHALLEVSTTSGTLLVNWAQNTSASPGTSILKGSYTQLQKVS